MKIFRFIPLHPAAVVLNVLEITTSWICIALAILNRTGFPSCANQSCSGYYDTYYTSSTGKGTYGRYYSTNSTAISLTVMLALYTLANVLSAIGVLRKAPPLIVIVPIL